MGPKRRTAPAPGEGNDYRRADNGATCSSRLPARVKELDFLFRVSRLLEKEPLALDDTLQEIVDQLPQAWQHPEITCVQLKLNERTYTSPNFRLTPWMLRQDVLVRSKVVGWISVYYLEERPPSEVGPFLREEQRLLAVVAERIGKLVLRERAQRDLRRAYLELERKVDQRTAELARANEELRREIEERERMEEELRSSAEAFKFFAYSVMHDIKNPAVAIYGLAEFLHRHYASSLDERGSEICSQILKAALHLATLVEKINVYIAAKEAPLALEPTNINEILEIVREEFAPRLAVRRVRWIAPTTPVWVPADRVALLRVFRNMVDNCLKYGGEQLSEIRIDYQQTDHHHVLSVSDDGVGMPEKDYRRIFALFERGHPASGIEGSGLGLAIVKEIAERHGGSVWAEPAPERGTRVSISISRDLQPGTS